MASNFARACRARSRSAGASMPLGKAKDTNTPIMSSTFSSCCHLHMAAPNRVRIREAGENCPTRVFLEHEQTATSPRALLERRVLERFRENGRQRHPG